MPRSRLAATSLVCLTLAAQPALRAAPTCAELLGFEPGTRPARHTEVVAFAERLAAASSRVRLARYGQTHEKRDLLLLTITSEANLARLDGIQRDIAILGDSRKPLAAEEEARLLRETPAVAFLAYSIHGDELSGADASVRLAHRLATADDVETRRLLDALVVLIDPMQNPDGRERILSMSASFQGTVPNPDPDALSHAGRWPWGRANHYLFDLNRDWFALVHPESRGKADILRTWLPQLVVDAHEMGSDTTFLFNPPRAPFNPNLPATARTWWDAFSRDQAAAFDAHGWSYYTREWNEEFFPGYGSAIALYVGAVGILHEQSSTDGQPMRKPHGGIETYAQAVDHQLVGSLANLGTAASRREELLRTWRAARKDAVERGRTGTLRCLYVAPAEPARAARLARTLTRLGIEVDRLRAPGAIAAARSPWADGAESVTLPSGALRVRLDQPTGLLARAVLEPHTPMPDSFLAEEREHLERQKGSRIYDTTAWSPLLASGLPWWWSSQLDRLSWDPVTSAESPAGGVGQGPATYGWAWDGARDAAVVLAADLAAGGVKVRVGEKPFTLEGREFSRGSFLVRAEENAASAAETLRARAAARGVEVHPASTARITQGPDLGGEHWLLLEEPRIGILAGDTTSFTSVGFAWHLLDAELALRVSLLDASRVDSVELQRYNVVVIPDGDSGGMRRALGDQGLDAVRTWVERGGTLVGVAAGAQLLADAEVKLSEVRRRGDVLEDHPAPAFGLGEDDVKALQRLQALGLDADGKPTPRAGAYTEERWPAELRIPGAGSPVLGPGTWALLGAAGDVARKRGSLLARPPGKDDGKGKEESGGDTDDDKDAAKRADERLRRFMPAGVILRVDLDPEHWLAFGAGDRVAVMVGTEDALIARDPVTTAGRYAAPSDLHLGGLLWPEAAGRLAQTAWLTREGKGRGQVILFAGDPCFRGTFWGTERLFLNAALLGTGVGTTRVTPW
jgi:hypothetical protein